MAIVQDRAVWRRVVATSFIIIFLMMELGRERKKKTVCDDLKKLITMP